MPAIAVPVPEVNSNGPLAIGFEEAAVRLSISKRTLERLADAQLFKSARLGRRRVISVQEVERLAREGV